MPNYDEPAIQTPWVPGTGHNRIDHDELAYRVRSFLAQYQSATDRAVTVQNIQGKEFRHDWDAQLDKLVWKMQRALLAIEKAAHKPMGRYRHPLWRAKNRLRILQLEVNHVAGVAERIRARR